MRQFVAFYPKYTLVKTGPKYQNIRLLISRLELYQIRNQADSGEV